MKKLYSPACERNREPILAVLRAAFANCTDILEIGSGTGQHAVYFARNLPHLRWQPSDLPEYHQSIRAWQEEENLPNLMAPLMLDVARDTWPARTFDGVFTANTCHIMAWEEVMAMFRGVGRVLRPGGVMAVYGPFNYAGRYTSDSNARFDAGLKAQGPHMGIRDVEAVQRLAAEQDLQLQADHEMPANNRLLVWRRELKQLVQA